MNKEEEKALSNAVLLNLAGALGLSIFLFTVCQTEQKAIWMFGKGLAPHRPKLSYAVFLGFSCLFVFGGSFLFSKRVARLRRQDWKKIFMKDAGPNALLAFLAGDLVLTLVLNAIPGVSNLPRSATYHAAFVAGLWVAAKCFRFDLFRQTGVPLPEGSKDNLLKYAWLASGVYIVLFGAMGVLQCLALCVQHVDSVTFEEMFWQTLHGRFAYSHTYGAPFLVDHVALTMYLFLPLYALHPALETVSLIQVIGIGLGGVPAYLVAKEVLKHRGAALACAAAYLACPGLHYSTLEVRDNVFDPNTPSAMLILWSFYFALRKRWALYFLFGALAMLCREDVCVSVFMVGLYVALVRRDWKQGLCGAAMGLGWLLISLYLIVPNFRRDQSLVFSYFSEMGNGVGPVARYMVHHPLKTLGRIATEQDIEFVTELTLPFGLLGFLSPSALALAGPAFGYSLLADSQWYSIVSIRFWYHIVHLPLVYVASVMGIRNLARVMRWLGDRVQGFRALGTSPHLESRCVRAGAAMMITSALVASLFLSKWPLSFAFYDPSDIFRHYSRYIQPEEARYVPEVQAQIPRKADISATDYLTQKFTHYGRIFRFPRGLEKADFVVINLNDRWFRQKFDTSKERTAAREMEHDPRFELVYKKAGLRLYRRTPRH